MAEKNDQEQDPLKKQGAIPKQRSQAPVESTEQQLSGAMEKVQIEKKRRKSQPMSPGAQGEGSPPKEQVEMGPRNWDEEFPSMTEVGVGMLRPWGLDNVRKEYTDKLTAHGYTFDWTKHIYKGKDSDFDHSIWKVSKPGKDGQPVIYACKIMSFNYYRQKFKDLKVSVEALRKEGETLLQLNHQNVTKVYESIALEDLDSKFPYNYIANIMELLQGSLDKLVKTYPERQMKPFQCKRWFRQVASGLEYLHYGIVEPKAQVITHMALVPRNILFKIVNSEPIFKLADFEECLSFDRSRIPAQDLDKFDNDFITSFYSKPYRTMFSGPELKQTNWAQMHSRPNDIYCFGSCLCYALTGSSKIAKLFREELKSMKNVTRSHLRLIQAMCDDDPRKRPNIRQVLKSEWLSKSDECDSDDPDSGGSPPVPSFLQSACR